MATPPMFVKMTPNFQFHHHDWVNKMWLLLPIFCCYNGQISLFSYLKADVLLDVCHSAKF